MLLNTNFNNRCYKFDTQMLLCIGQHTFKITKMLLQFASVFKRAVSINLFSYTTNILEEQNMNELLRVFLFKIFYSATNVMSCSLDCANFESFKRQTFLSCCILSNAFYIKVFGFSKLITYCL